MLYTQHNTTLHYTTLNYNFNKLKICSDSLLTIHKRDKTTRKLLYDYYFLFVLT